MPPAELRDEKPRVKRLETEAKRPVMPRRREATWSFHMADRRSMPGTTDCVTISRTNARMAVASDSKMYGVGSSSTSEFSETSQQVTLSPKDTEVYLYL